MYIFERKGAAYFDYEGRVCPAGRSLPTSELVFIRK